MIRLTLLFPLLTVLAILFSPAPSPLPPPERTMAVPHGNGRFVEIEGRTIYMREWPAEGTRRGRILLVHGFGGSTFSWEKTAPALASRGWDIVAADIPGFGYSEKTPSGDYRLTEMARLFWSLADGISREDWILVGHSMGGDVVARMAAARPARTRFLVEVDGAVGNGQAQPRTAPSFMECTVPRAIASGALALGARLKFAVRPLLASAYGRAVSEAELAGYMAPLAMNGTFSTLLYLAGQRKEEPGALGDLLAYARPDGSGTRAGRGLLVWGEKDSWIPPASGTELAHLTGFRLAMIPQAAHCPMETHPEAFLDIVLSELDGLDMPSGSGKLDGLDGLDIPSGSGKLHSLDGLDIPSGP